MDTSAKISTFFAIKNITGIIAVLFPLIIDWFCGREESKDVTSIWACAGVGVKIDAVTIQITSDLELYTGTTAQGVWAILKDKGRNYRNILKRNFCYKLGSF